MFEYLSEISGDVAVYMVNSTEVQKFKIKELIQNTHFPESLSSYGLVVQCNDVECIYEFRFFCKKPTS